MSRPNSGFTLLETLTSISIVALLLVLLIPQAGRVRNADGFQVSMANWPPS
jgi:prepilin-type N-terminal cleavage/methylation domain-containing protein